MTKLQNTDKEIKHRHNWKLASSWIGRVNTVIILLLLLALKTASPWQHFSKRCIGINKWILETSGNSQQSLGVAGHSNFLPKAEKMNFTPAKPDQLH